MSKNIDDILEGYAKYWRECITLEPSVLGEGAPAINTKQAKQAIQNLIAQETNKARIDEAEKALSNFKMNGNIGDSYFKQLERVRVLTADKEQA